jgi:hypothetical protein
LTALSANAAVLFTEPFTAISTSNTAYPTAAAAATNYWTDDGTYNYVNRNSSANPTNLAFTVDRQAGYADWNYADSYLSRDLTVSGELSSGQTFKDAVLVANVSFQSGSFNRNQGDDGPTDLSLIGHRVRVLDSSNNGYMGDLRYNGDIYLFRIVSGVATQIGSDTNGTMGSTVGARTVTLSVTGGNISLTDSLNGTPFTVADSNYNAFSQVGLGARIKNEVGFLESIEVSGSVIPEPGSFALLAAAGAGLMLLRRRARRD